MMVQLVLVFIFMLSLSCSQKVSVLNGQSDTISGTITGLTTSSANAALTTCSTETIKLFSINENGAEDALIAEATVSTNGQFTFNNLISKGVHVGVQSQNVKYLLRFTCGSEILNRYVTGSNGQNVDYGSTLLSWFSYTNESSKLKDVPVASWAQLYTQLQGAASVEDAYSIIVANTNIAQAVATSGLDVAALNDAAPILTSVTVPPAFSEEASNVLSALAHHWSPSYSMAYEWRLNGQLLANTISHNYIPPANSQGSYTLQFFVGQNNGSGLVDTSKPYVQKVFTTTINNTVLPAPPSMIRLSALTTNSTNQSVRINTGASYSTTFYNCRSFSSLAIVEESSFLPALPPTNHSLYTVTCTTAMQQDIPFTSSGVEGSRALRLWAMDASGAISGASQEILFNYDVTAPVLTLASPSAGSVFSSGTTLTGSCESGLTVNLAGSGITSTTTSCVSGAFSAPIVFSPGDGAKTVTATQTDDAGNSTTISRSFLRDSAPPVLSFTAPASMTMAVAGISISGTCEDGLTVNIGGAGATIGTTSCSGGTFSTAIGFSNGDGTKTVEVSQMDAAGNVGVASRAFVRDSTAPVLTFTSPASNSGSKTGPTVTGTCETGLMVTLTGIDITTATTSCSAGTFSQTLSFTGADGTYSVRAEQTDSVGNTGDAQRLFVKDNAAPTASVLVINNNDANTGNRNIVVNLQATSPRSDISAFCLKMDNTTKPTAGDSCWITLSSLSLPVTDSLNIASYPFQIGSLLGTYTLRVWYKDDLGNISDNLADPLKDMDDILYQPDPPPTVTNVTLTNTDTFTQPLTSSETTALFNSDIYIKWNVTDNHPIPSGAITLHYTENDTGYTSIATNLNNGANGGCTIDAGTTGCVRLTASSPLNTYYKIRITVKDSGDYITMATSNAVNTEKFVSLSGNTSLGIGGSATSAILIGRNEGAFVDYLDTQALVVTKKGELFFNYLNRGLAQVSPTTGMLTLVAPQTGTAAGNGGPLSSATFGNIRRIMLDHQDNLLIWDTAEVRYVDLSQTTRTVERLFGGGSDTADGALGTAAQLNNIGTDTAPMFTPVPNGRVYYEKSREIWYYDPADLRVHRWMTLTGTGTLNFATFDWAACGSNNTAIAYDKSNSTITKILRRASISSNASCGSTAGTSSHTGSFDPASGVATAPHPTHTSWSSTAFAGLDGKIYVLEQGRARLLRYNPVTNTYDPIVGTSAGNGRCDDDTLATACRAVIMSAFVNEFGRVYFLDMGVIRTIDDTGRVQTIAGQPRNFGIGEAPTSARYSQINFFTVKGNDVYVINKLENQIVKFSLTGGNLEHVAGSTALGSASHDAVAKNAPLPTCDWAMPCSLMVDDVSQRLYYRSGNKFSYIDLTTGKWNVSSTIIQDSSTRLSYLGINNDRVIAYAPSHAGTAGNKATLREINSSGSNTLVFGQDAYLLSLATNLCDNADPLGCTLAHTSANLDVQTQIKHDATTNNWIIGMYNRNYINTLPVGGGTTNRLETTNNAIAAFDFKYSGADMILYYCGTDGNLYKRNVTTNVENQLLLPSTTIRCSGQALHYHPVRNSLIFIYKQNDMFGIAEYNNP